MESPKIFLCDLSDEFINGYLELINDQLVSETTEPGAELEEFSREQALKWLKSLNEKKDRKDHAILLKETGQFVGEVVVNEIINASGNIRIALCSQFFDQGFGTEAMKLAIDHAFNDLGLEELTLSVYEINKRGLKVYQRLGFVETSRELVEDYIEIHMSLKRNDWISYMKSSR